MRSVKDDATSRILEINDKISEMNRKISDDNQNAFEREKAYEADLLELRLQNLNAYYDAKKKAENQTKNFSEALENDAFEKDTKRLNAQIKAEEDARKNLWKNEAFRANMANKRRIQAELEFQKTQLETNNALTEAERAFLEDKLRANEAQLELIEKQTKEYEKQAKQRQKNELSLAKTRETIDKNRENKAKREAGKKLAQDWSEGITGKGYTMKERLDTLRSGFKDQDGDLDLKKGLALMTNALSSLTQKLDSKIENIASYRSAIDTRLQGSKNETRMGSYWDQISADITGVAGVSPFVKQDEINKNIASMVDAGIAYNVEQRAFLSTIKDKIATTFNAFDGTLLRLVRIQQQDTTAARLGMESALTTFLNSMYETTEYMKGVADSVRSNLQETMSLMSATDAVGLEYEVQKWVGSMYSVGMSQNAVSAISSALGKVLAGDVSGITSGGAGNLMVMAANQAGLSIADILRDGLNSDETNSLLRSMVDYLDKIYEQSSNSRVIQQQIASVYGITASDLKAIHNLAGDNSTMKSISSSALSYSEAIDQLNYMASTMFSRVSLGEMMTNAWDNFQYTMAAGIANDPVTYGIYKAAGLLDDLVGGIAIPAISVFGNMVDLHTTVADLMRVGALSASAIKGVAAMISAGGGGGLSGTGMLKALGIGGDVTTVQRGSYSGKRTVAGKTVSESGGMVGNSSGNDIKQATMNAANDEGNEQLQVKQEESQETSLDDVNNSIKLIYELLLDATQGTVKFHTNGGLDTPSGWN